MKKQLLISFSGGRTSAFMTQWLLKNKSAEFDMVVVFSNTGKERKETLDFVKQCDEYFNFNTVWMEPVTSNEWGVGMRSKVVNFDSAARNGEPFEQMIAKYGIPNRTRPFCSEYMKKLAIRHYAKSIGWKHYFTAIGIRADEFDRMSVHKEKERLIYPLVSMIETKKEDINLFFSKLPFDLRLKNYEGNCDFCWKKSQRKLLTIAKENPQLVQWWQQMEIKYGYFIPSKSKITGYIKTPLQFYRGDVSATSILELSKKPFTPAVDDSHNMPKHDPELDTSNGCEESCEAF